MPMPFAGGKPNDIAWPHFLSGSPINPNPAAARNDDQGLTKRMGMPCRTRARLESYNAATDARWRLTLKTRIDAHLAGKVFRRAPLRGL